MVKGYQVMSENTLAPTVFQGVSCQDILGNISRELAVVDVTDTAGDALMHMYKHRVRSVPVRPEVKDGGSGEDFVGILDVLDIVAAVDLSGFVLDIVKAHSQDPSSIFDQVVKTDVKGFIGIDSELKTGTLSNRLIVVDGDVPITSILHEMISGIPRVLIKSQDLSKSPNYHMLSKFDIVNFLVNNTEKLPQAFRVPIKTLDHKFSPRLIVLEKHENALTGFIKMLENDYDAAAVVDGDGSLVSTLSAFDLCTTFANNKCLKKLQASIMELLSDEAEGNDEARPKSQVFVTEQYTLSEAMDVCVQNHIHRVWLVDEQRKPVGVIDINDFLAFL